ncbi:MAG: hypothetical protein WA563_06005 [Candidatus Acidiferrales bacterium]
MPSMSAAGAKKPEAEQTHAPAHAAKKPDAADATAAATKAAEERPEAGADGAQVGGVGVSAGAGGGSVGERVHEPGDGEGKNDENEEVAEGGEETFFGGALEDAGEDDGDEQGAEKQGGKLAERQFGWSSFTRLAAMRDGASARRGKEYFARVKRATGICQEENPRNLKAAAETRS